MAPRVNSEKEPSALKKAAKFFFLFQSFGLLKRYQQKAMQLAKIKAASVYLEGVKTVRKYFLFNFLVVFAAALLAGVLLIVPLMLVLLMPWELSVKIGAVLGLGIVDLAASLVILWQLFSEEKWIRFSGAERFIDETLNGN